MPRHCRTLAAQADDKLMIKDYEFALLFDCDGVILETEELHRRAYNTAFREFNLTIHGVPVEWDVSTLVVRWQKKRYVSLQFLNTASFSFHYTTLSTLSTH